MFGRSLLPSLWRQTDVSPTRGEEHPLSVIQRDMNRLFDDFFRDMGTGLWSGPGERLNRFVPSLDVIENDKEFTIKAELPGMDEKDVEGGTAYVKRKRKRKTRVRTTIIWKGPMDRFRG